MIVLAIGAPTIFATFSFKVVRAIFDAVAPNCFHVEASSLEHLHKASAENSAVILTSHLPEVKLVEFAADRNHPLLLFWTDGEEIIVDHIRFGASFLTSARLASKYLAALECARELRSTVIFRHPPPRTALADFVSEIAAAAGANLDSGLHNRIMRTIVPDYNPDETVLLETAMDRRTMEIDVADHIPKEAPAFSQLRVLFGADRVGDAPWSWISHWPPVLFSAPIDNTISIDPIVELTGAARAFINGPYFHLPAGSWRASIRFRLWSNETNNSFRFEVRCGESLSGGDFKLPTAGEFSCDLDFVTPGAEFVVEFRLILLEGAIGGQFELLSVTVRPNDGSDLPHASRSGVAGGGQFEHPGGMP